MWNYDDTLQDTSSDVYFVNLGNKLNRKARRAKAARERKVK